ncbi:MAG: fatty acyl-AMP ligase [Pseudomonadales bacterium]|nr:fatty acyl-AMP ligase [Pseudomonadales bacterium]
MTAELQTEFASTLPEALDRAARTDHGMTFFDSRGAVERRISYGELRDRSLELAGRLAGAGFKPGERIAMVAETRLDFVQLFFACQYAGLVPVPLNASVNLGGRDSYVRQLAFLVRNCEARALFGSDAFLEFMTEAAGDLGLAHLGTLEAFENAFVERRALPQVTPADHAYVQYTSGSTRVARGVLMTQRAVMTNLRAIIFDGLKLRPDDRFFSWLPFYHDMGLVGKLLTPVAGRASVAYLDSRHFALRPRLWLKLLEETGATISFGPSFGYGLCARRMRDGEGAGYDLSRWRVAGIGAEMIRMRTIEEFLEAVAGSGFDASALLPCYGMAEVGLAISFSELGGGVHADRVDRQQCMEGRRAVPHVPGSCGPTLEFVSCGRPLAGIEVEIRDSAGRRLPDRMIGTIYAKTDSVMDVYLNNPEASAEALVGGWLNTGDLGYLVDGNVVITGREKDLIIVHGRNYWPQDLEYVAEQHPGVRAGDAMAFSLEDGSGNERVVMLVQCRELDAAARERMRSQIEARVRAEFSCDCEVELVGAHTLPRTSSGKPSRSRARADYAASLGLAGNDAGGWQHLMARVSR